MQAINSGADLNTRDNNNSQTPLSLAQSRNNLAVVDLLLRLGASKECLMLKIIAKSQDQMLDIATFDKGNHKIHRWCRSDTSSNAEIALRRNFPVNVAEAMIQKRQIVVVSKASVSVLFLNVTDYAKMRGSMSPVKMLKMLELLFHTFDDLATEYGVERIDTIDGCYMAAANFSISQPADHAARLARFALVAVQAAASIAIDEAHPDLGTVRLLAGMHCGTVCGRVVGTHGGRKHTLHGDAVNVASRMESHGAPGAVQCSSAAAALIEAQGGCNGESLQLTRRGEVVDIKGVGRMRTFWVSLGAYGWPQGGVAHNAAPPVTASSNSGCGMETNRVLPGPAAAWAVSL